MHFVLMHVLWEGVDRKEWTFDLFIVSGVKWKFNFEWKIQYLYFQIYV